MQKLKKQKSKRIYNLFALKNLKLLVLKNTKIVQTTTNNKKLKVGGLRPPTFNNNLIDINFGFNKPICKFDNDKIL